MPTKSQTSRPWAPALENPGASLGWVAGSGAEKWSLGICTDQVLFPLRSFPKLGPCLVSRGLCLRDTIEEACRLLWQPLAGVAVVGNEPSPRFTQKAALPIWLPDTFHGDGHSPVCLEHLP